MASGEAEVQHVRFRAIWLKEHTDGGNVIYSVGDQDKTSHIGNDVLMNVVGEDTTFKDLGDIVKAKIKGWFEVYEQDAKTHLIEKAGKSEEDAQIEAAKMVLLFNQKLDSDFAVNALVFRAFFPGVDELTEGDEPDVIGDENESTFDLHDESSTVIDVVEADENGSEYTTIFFGRVKVNEDLEGILCAGSHESGEASTKVHKGAWEQSLIDAANAAIEARKM